MVTAQFMEAAAQTQDMQGTWGGGPGFPWFLIFPFLWFLVIGSLIFFGRRMWWKRVGNGQQSAEAIIRERYARGEVSEEEYRTRLAVLGSDKA